MASIQRGRACINVNMPIELSEKVVAEAAMLDRSETWVIRKALLEYFERRTVAVQKESENA